MIGATSEPRFPLAKQKVTRPDAYFLVGAFRPLDQAGGQVQNYQRSAISAIGPCNHVFMPRVCADAFRDCRNRFPSSQKDCERHERHQRRSALERSSRDPAWDVLRLDLPTKCSVAHAGGPEHQRPRGVICGRGLEGRLSRGQGPRLDLGHSLFGALLNSFESKCSWEPQYSWEDLLARGRARFCQLHRRRFRRRR